jgi:hypothetical protein
LDRACAAISHPPEGSRTPWPMFGHSSAPSSSRGGADISLRAVVRAGTPRSPGLEHADHTPWRGAPPRGAPVPECLTS